MAILFPLLKTRCLICRLPQADAQQAESLPATLFPRCVLELHATIFFPYEKEW